MKNAVDSLKRKPKFVAIHLCPAAQHERRPSPLRLCIYNEVRSAHSHTSYQYCSLKHTHILLNRSHLFLLSSSIAFFYLLLLLFLDLLPEGLEDDGHAYFTKLHSQVINNKMPYSYKYSKNTAGLCLFSGALKIHTHLANC